MGEFLNHLREGLQQICPSFLHVPPQTPYPYITLEAEQILKGLPWGPSMVMVRIKIWSRYAGTQEILKLAKAVESFLQTYHPLTFHISLKLVESGLILLSDGQTRIHEFRLKTRLSGGLS